jgi:ribosome-associated protein
LATLRHRGVDRQVVQDWAVAAAAAADEKKGTDTVVLDVGAVLAITDFFVITSAPNKRLVRTLADEVELKVRAAGGPSPLRVEGLSESSWVLMDYGDLVVHVFVDEMRRFYDIERLYRDVPVVRWQMG